MVVASDTAIERHLPKSQSLINRSSSFSDYGLAAFAGASVGAYALGRFRGSDRLRQTGLLSAEALADSFLATEVIKTAAGRNRPLEGDGRGRWFQGGTSFPSEHSAAVWSAATVIAGQYPGWMTRFLAYGGAAAVSGARVVGRQHFASDAVIGSALGWYIGHHVLSHSKEGEDRQKELAGMGVFHRRSDENQPSRVKGPELLGSPYVPLDSWIYPAFDRLIALGYVRSAFAGLRPWTRLECSRLLTEAGEEVPEAPFAKRSGATSALPERHGGDRKQHAEAGRVFAALNQEFAHERALLEGDARNLSARIESVYTRFTGISGRPLTNGYYFGQTVINDFGRPYQEGFNNVTGASGDATAGPAVLHMRGEYQRAPSAGSLPAAARQFIGRADALPTPPDTPVATTNRFEILDAYAGLNIYNWQVTFGRQSLWWGPGVGGPMMFSNNAEPITMLRLNRVSPFKLPSFLGVLGPMRLEVFLGQLNGYQFVQSPSGLVGQWGQSLDPQPYIHGQKLSFKPTPNFELGFSRTTIYGGPGYPFTLYNFGRSLFSLGNDAPGAKNKPGDRRSGLDFSYRLPKLRNWLTFYADGFTDDQFSPIAYWDRSVWHAGLYLAHVPGVPKMDLRAEGTYSNNPLGGAICCGFFYQNGTWKTGYQNAGNLIGSWIGRDGQGAQGWATYHFTPKSNLQLSFRHQKVGPDFLPGGGTLTDFSVGGNLWLRPTMSVSGSVQYERWTYPILTSTPQSNVTTSVQLTYWPRRFR